MSLLRFRPRRSDESGQAMTEYAATTMVLLIGGISAGAGWPFFSAMMKAFDIHLASVLFILNTPFP